MTEIYIVYLYCDYRKEVDIQFLKAFKSREEAIVFASKYTNTLKGSAEYVSIKGTEYDAPFYEIDEEECVSEEDYQVKSKLEQDLRDELNVKKNMWYLRIGVDKIILV